jgi:outer membrane protein assembly factor BamB
MIDTLYCTLNRHPYSDTLNRFAFNDGHRVACQKGKSPTDSAEVPYIQIVRPKDPMARVYRGPLRLALLLLCIFLCHAGAAEQPDTGQAFWPQWRGPDSTGASNTAKPPTTWSENLNVRWKHPLTGKSHATPIVWGDFVYITTADPVGEPFAPRHADVEGAHDNVPVRRAYAHAVLAIHRRTGETAWRTDVKTAIPHEGGHYSGSLAAASPCTDGERLYAHFGSQGLFALNMQGKQLWQQQLGTMQTRHAHGEGSSPALHGDTLVVAWDHEGQSFIAAFDTTTGEQRWKTLRDVNTSWSSPVIIADVDPPQVVIAATGRVRAYRLDTGKEIWSCDGLSRNVVATPVYGDGILYAANSYDWQALLAIRVAGATGDITATDHLVWSTKRLTPYVPSPLLYNDTIYFLRHNHNVLSGLDALSGEARHDPVRLLGMRELFASPVAASNRIYLTGRDGVVSVYDTASPPKRLAQNRLNDAFCASPALAGSELYLRGERFLYCISADTTP